jgi:hypothetical protein
MNGCGKGGETGTEDDALQPTRAGGTPLTMGLLSRGVVPGGPWTTSIGGAVTSRDRGLATFGAYLDRPRGLPQAC